VTEPSAVRRFLWPKTLAGKAGVISLVFAATLVAVYFVAMKYSSQRLAEAWKLSDEFGLPNDFIELLGPFVPPERNMAVALDRAATTAAQFMLAERAKLKNQDDDYLADAKFLEATDALLKDPNYEPALADADRLTEYYSPVVVTEKLFSIMLTYLQTRRDLVRTEQAIARRLVSQGKRDEAARRLVRFGRLTRRWEEKEPFLIGALINIALRTVVIAELNLILRRGGPLAADLHDEIDREMAEWEAITRVIPRIGQTEKIAAVNDYADFSPLGKTSLLRPVADNDKAFLIRYMHRWMKTADRPLYQIRGELGEIESDLKRVVGDPLGRILHMGAAMMAPAVHQARLAFDRTVAHARCLRIVNALARRGDFQAPFDSLGLSRECLIDPFDGKPIRMKRTAGGPIVYSVGTDYADDGGTLESVGGKNWDVGLGPPKDVEAKK
jgi:hypothetical protein